MANFAKMKIHSFTFNPFQENTYIIWDEGSLECVIVDAGNSNPEENIALKSFIENNQLIPKMLLGTHAHIDHVFGNWFVKQEWNIPYYLNINEHVMLDRSVQMASLWQLNYTPSPAAEFNLNHGDIITVGHVSLEVRFVPGHSPGHVVFIHHQSHSIIGGDCLFRGSIGRTDLPGGNHDLLIEKIKTEMFSLPDNYLVYSGHGPETNIGYEKEHNPFLQF
jgi:hydroxyacylglutathione hydrolase